MLIRRMKDFHHLHKFYLFICTFYPYYPAFMCWWESLDTRLFISLNRAAVTLHVVQKTNTENITVVENKVEVFLN